MYEIDRRVEKAAAKRNRTITQGKTWGLVQLQNDAEKKLKNFIETMVSQQERL